MDTTTCGAVLMLTAGVKLLRDSLINTICVFSMKEPTPIWLSSPACEQANVSDRSDHFHTRTCFEKRVGGPTRYPWQWPLSHTDFNPTISGRYTTKLWSFPLGFSFSKANWEQFHDMCLESISEDILEEADPLHSFVEHITKAANDCIPRATTIPKKSNTWFDEECREALKARRALDKRVRHSRALRGETISAFRRSQAKARRLFNQKKRQSWAEYVSKLSAETPIKHMCDRVKKISGKNICPPKQHLNGKNGTTITDPKDIANEHAAVFIDNSSSAHYSATFQAIKEHELGQHSLTNSTQRKVFQLAVSWLWHVLDWRLMGCPLVLPRTSSKHSLSMTWWSVLEDALWRP